MELLFEKWTVDGKVMLLAMHSQHTGVRLAVSRGRPTINAAAAAPARHHRTDGPVIILSRFITKPVSTNTTGFQCSIDRCRLLPPETTCGCQALQALPVEITSRDSSNHCRLRFANKAAWPWRSVAGGSVG